MGNDNVLDQSEIERLLGGMGGGAASPSPPVPAAAPAADSGGVLDQSELDALFGGLSQSAAPTPGPVTAPAPQGSTPRSVNSVLDQSEIESLLGGVKAAPPSPAPAPAASASRPAPSQPAKPIGMGAIGGPTLPAEPAEEDEEGIPRGDIDYILKRADESIQSIATTKLDLPIEVIEFQYPEFGGTVPSNEHATLDQISEVELDVKIELGRANMYLEDILKLRKGSVVPLDKMAGDAVDIYINGRLLARGEVLVMNENFCVRVAELLAGAIPLE